MANRSKILDLHHVKHTFINGNVPPAQRQSSIDTFKNDPATRVLIMSSVGAIGLNLSCANVVIFLVR